MVVAVAAPASYGWIRLTCGRIRLTNGLIHAHGHRISSPRAWLGAQGSAHGYAWLGHGNVCGLSGAAEGG